MPPRVRAALPVDTVELRAAGQAPAPSSGHLLRRQALALLVAAALEDEATGLRLHALAEPVGASPLALLRLGRALHGRGGLASGQFSEFPRSLHGRLSSGRVARQTSCMLAPPLDAG